MMEDDDLISGLDFAENQIIVAMDHARYFGRIDGLQDPGRVLERVIDAGVDGVMASYGVVKYYQDELVDEIPTILRLDGGSSVYREEWLHASEWRLLHTIEDAMSLGVDGVCVMLFMGSAVELKTMQIVAELAGACDEGDIELLVEALPCPCPAIPDPLDANAMAAACRLAFEHGADAVKTYYTGDPDSFQTVVDNCPVPTLIAGGARMDSDQEVLQVVHGSIQAGAKGLVFGRNIWQHPDPSAMVAALRQIVHEDSTVEQALTLLA